MSHGMYAQEIKKLFMHNGTYTEELERELASETSISMYTKTRVHTQA